MHIRVHERQVARHHIEEVGGVDGCDGLREGQRRGDDDDANDEAKLELELEVVADLAQLVREVHDQDAGSAYEQAEYDQGNKKRVKRSGVRPRGYVENQKKRSTTVCRMDVCGYTISSSFYVCDMGAT